MAKQIKIGLTSLVNTQSPQTVVTLKSYGNKIGSWLILIRQYFLNLGRLVKEALILSSSQYFLNLGRSVKEAFILSSSQYIGPRKTIFNGPYSKNVGPYFRGNLVTRGSPMFASYGLKTHLVLRSQVLLKTPKRSMLTLMRDKIRPVVHQLFPKPHPVYQVVNLHLPKPLSVLTTQTRSKYTVMHSDKPEEIKINKEPMAVFVSPTETITLDPKIQQALEKFIKKHPKIVSDEELNHPESFRGKWLCVTHKVPSKKLEQKYDFKVIAWVQIANDAQGKPQFVVALNRRMTWKELHTMPVNRELTAHVKADPNFIPSVDSLVEKAKNFWNQTAETASKDSMQQLKNNAKNNKKQANIHHDNQNNEHP